MRIIDNYILSKVVTSYLLILLCFIGLHLIIDLFSTLADFLREKVPISVIGTYYLNFLPQIFLRTSKFSLLISILFSVGELNRNNEITSMRASGISMARLTVPVLFFALFISCVAFFLQEKIFIHSQKKTDRIKVDYIKKPYKGKGEERNFGFRWRNQRYFVSRFLPQENALYDVEITTINETGDIVEKTFLRKMQYAHGAWTAYEMRTNRVDEKGKDLAEYNFFEEKTLGLDETPHTIALKKNPFGQDLSIHSLKEEINIERMFKTTASGRINSLIIDFHTKITEPFSHLFLAIGILPFALEIRKRKVGLSALAGGFIFGFLYYLIYSISIALGRADIIIPAISSWVAPLFFIAMGISGMLLMK